MPTLLTIRVDDTVLNVIEKHGGNLPKLMETAANRQYTRVRSEMKRDVDQDANRPQPDLPYVWSLNPIANTRARRWYFANVVPQGGDGGRYPRTGEMQRGWSFTGKFTQNGGEIRIGHRSNRFKYVHRRNFQNPSHRRNERITLEDMQEKYTPILSVRIAETWLTVANPFAGVR